MGYDLEALNTNKTSEEGRWLELEHPATNEPLDIHLKLMGKDSDQYRKQVRRNQDKNIKKGLRKLKSEHLENETIELLTACTLEWRGVVHNGKELDFTKENVRWLYKTYSWAKDQVDEFIGDYSNYMGE